MKEWIGSLVFLLLPVCVATAGDAPVIASFGDGQITWTNVNPGLYYTVEWVPALSDTTLEALHADACHDAKERASHG